MNQPPFQRGGRYGPGQELLYCGHRLRLWLWFCIQSGRPLTYTHGVYRETNKVLRELCLSLGLMAIGDNTSKVHMIAMLDNYEFTNEQMNILYPSRKYL